MLLKKAILSSLAASVCFISSSAFSVNVLESDVAHQQVMADMEEASDRGAGVPRSVPPEQVGNTGCAQLRRFARAMSLAGLGGVAIPHMNSRFMGIAAFSIAGMTYGLSTIPDCERVVYHSGLGMFSCEEKDQNTSISVQKN